ncbi:hypothetical protein BB559_000688 [Furculomyces boomerangus]|uniref:Peptidase S1 domain-containing protein n=2 Tax=Harpellales TaxID=61421 RepID=A0A2T9Z4C7_9FUNG|nr:hypothetical protein BB559_000688 [Furculomyces boomerangus]PWA01779.1 hypothetical protein BB558_002116 [Smittium angustum]PWA03098.1 hypothetical protein BB558_000733 [Smittium angustum]
MKRDSATFKQVNAQDFNFLVYVFTPFEVCYGALLTPNWVITSGLCLQPFDDSDITQSFPITYRKLSETQVFVGRPSTNNTNNYNMISSYYAGIPVVPNVKQIVDTFARTGQQYIGSGFVEVEKVNINSNYQLVNDYFPGIQKFDTSLLKLKTPINSGTVKLGTGSMASSQKNLKAITYAPISQSVSIQNGSQVPSTSVDVIYGKVGNFYNLLSNSYGANSISEKDCQNYVLKIYGLTSIDQLKGPAPPANPFVCTTPFLMPNCQLDSSISLMPISEGAETDGKEFSTLLVSDLTTKSTLSYGFLNWTMIVDTGSDTSDGTNVNGNSVVLYGLGKPFQYWLPSSSPGSGCSGMGVTHFPRIGIHTAWIQQVTGLSIDGSGALASFSPKLSSFFSLSLFAFPIFISLLF